MKKKKIILIAVSLAILAGGGVWPLAVLRPSTK